MCREMIERVARSNVPRRYRLLLAMLAHRQNGKTGRPCNAGTKRLAADAALSEREVGKQLAWLEAKGWITRHFNSGKTTSYELHVGQEQTPGLQAEGRDRPPVVEVQTPGLETGRPPVVGPGKLNLTRYKTGEADSLNASGRPEASPKDRESNSPTELDGVPERLAAIAESCGIEADYAWQRFTARYTGRERPTRELPERRAFLALLADIARERTESPTAQRTEQGEALEPVCLSKGASRLAGTRHTGDGARGLITANGFATRLDQIGQAAALRHRAKRKKAF